jgi:hypothetical protein
MKRVAQRNLRGFTLVEMVIGLMVTLVAGGIIFSAIRTIALLGAKNGAVNYTNQQSRVVIHKAVSNIRAAVSVPSLMNTSLATVSGNGPAAGVTYQTFVAGPYHVWSNAAAGTSTIRVTSTAGDPAPVAGTRLIIPAFRIEDDIASTASMGGNPPTYNVTLAHPISTTITCANGSPSYVVYYTQRAALVVVGQDLRYYPRISSGTYYTIASNITTPTPFSIPSGTNQFVQATFNFLDPKVSGLNLRSVNTTFSVTVPYRYKLTSIQ